MINSDCLYFENKNTNTTDYCRVNRAQYFSPNTYRECLQCFIEFQHIKIINQSMTNSCKQNFECIEFQFYNNTLFEFFFHNYLYLLKDLFKISNHSQSVNSLHIKIIHDSYKELTLKYIQSILKANGIDYSYLAFYLSNHRKQILLDLETDLSKIRLNAIRIEIVCNENTTYTFDITRDVKPVIHSNTCQISQSNENKNSSRKTTTRIHTSTINILLFIGGLIVFSIWILCICLCLYLRYYKWKINDSFNQRTSIVSSLFSTDSLNSRKDDILFSEEKTKSQVSKRLGHYGLYKFDNDF